MDTIDRVRSSALEAGRRYLELCAQETGVAIGEFVDNLLACEAVGCIDSRSSLGELSIWVCEAVPLDSDIPDGQLIQWCYDVEDEFRTRPRPMISPNIVGNVCLLREE